MTDAFHRIADEIDALASARRRRSLSTQRLLDAAATVRDAATQAAREDLADMETARSFLRRFAATYGPRGAATVAYGWADEIATEAAHA